MIQRHEALRSYQVWTNGRWQQRVAPPPSLQPLETHDMRTLGAAAAAAQCVQVGNRLLERFLLGALPRIRAAHIRQPEPAGDLLLITADHLTIDLVSLGIVLDEFLLAYDRLRQRRSVTLPPVASYQHHMRHLEQLARSDLSSAIQYWASRHWPAAARLAEAGQTAASATMKTEWYGGRLSVEQTASLQATCAEDGGLHLSDLCLNALALAVRQATGREPLLELVRSGRSDPVLACDCTDTVGLLVYAHPLLLDPWPARSDMAAVRATRKQSIEAARHGLAYRLIRHLRPDLPLSATLATHAEPEVTFNFHGDYRHTMFTNTSQLVDRLFSRVDRVQHSMPHTSPDAPSPVRRPLLVVGSVQQGALVLQCRADLRRVPAGCARRLVQAMLESLRHLA